MILPPPSYKTERTTILGLRTVRGSGGCPEPVINSLFTYSLPCIRKRRYDPNSSGPWSWGRVRGDSGKQMAGGVREDLCTMGQCTSSLLRKFVLFVRKFTGPLYHRVWTSGTVHRTTTASKVVHRNFPRCLPTCLPTRSFVLVVGPSVETTPGSSGETWHRQSFHRR